MATDLDPRIVIRAKDDETAGARMGGGSKGEGAKLSMEFGRNPQVNENLLTNCAVPSSEKKMNLSSGRLHSSGPRFKTVPARPRKLPAGLVVASRSPDENSIVKQLRASACSPAHPADGGDAAVSNSPCTQIPDIETGPCLQEDARNRMMLQESRSVNEQFANGNWQEQLIVLPENGERVQTPHSSPELFLSGEKNGDGHKTMEVSSHTLTNSGGGGGYHRTCSTTATVTCEGNMEDASPLDEMRHSLILAERIEVVSGAERNIPVSDKLLRVIDESNESQEMKCPEAVGVSVKDSGPVRMLEECELASSKDARQMAADCNNARIEGRSSGSGVEGKAIVGLSHSTEIFSETRGVLLPAEMEMPKQRHASLHDGQGRLARVSAIPLRSLDEQGNCVLGRGVTEPCGTHGKSGVIQNMDEIEAEDSLCCGKEVFTLQSSSGYAVPNSAVATSDRSLFIEEVKVEDEMEAHPFDPRFEGVPSCPDVVTRAYELVKLESDVDQAERQTSAIEVGTAGTSCVRQFFDDCWGSELHGEQLRKTLGGRHPLAFEIGSEDVGDGVGSGWLSLSCKGELQESLEKDLKSCASNVRANREDLQVRSELLMLSLGLGLDVGGSEHIKREEGCELRKESGLLIERGGTFWRGTLTTREGLPARVKASYLNSGAHNVAVLCRLAAVLEATVVVDLHTVVEALASGSGGPPFQLLVDDQLDDEDSYQNLHEIALSLLNGSYAERAVFVRSPITASIDATTLSTQSESSMYILSRPALESVLGSERCTDLEFCQDWPVVYAILTTGQQPPIDCNFITEERGVQPGDSAIPGDVQPAHVMELLVGVNGIDSGGLGEAAEGGEKLGASDLISLEIALRSGEAEMTTPTFNGIATGKPEGITDCEMRLGIKMRGSGNLDLSLGPSKPQGQASCAAAGVGGSRLTADKAEHLLIPKREPMEYPPSADHLPARVMFPTEIVSGQDDELSVQTEVDMQNCMEPVSPPRDHMIVDDHGEVAEPEVLADSVAEKRDASANNVHQSKMEIDVDADVLVASSPREQLKSTVVTPWSVGSGSCRSLSRGSESKERARHSEQQESRTAAQPLRAQALENVELPRKKRELPGKSLQQKGVSGRGGELEKEAGQDRKRSENREHRRGRSMEPKRNHPRSRSRERRRSVSRERRRSRSLEHKHGKSREVRQRDERLEVNRNSNKQPFKEELDEAHGRKGKEQSKRANREGGKKEERDFERKHDRSEKSFRRVERREPVEGRPTERGDVQWKAEKLQQPSKREERSAEHENLGSNSGRHKDGRDVRGHGRERASDEVSPSIVVRVVHIPHNPLAKDSRIDADEASPASGVQTVGRESKELDRVAAVEMNGTPSGEGKCRPVGKKSRTNGAAWPVNGVDKQFEEPLVVSDVQMPSQALSEPLLEELRDDRPGWNNRHSCAECGIQATCLRNLEDHYKGKKHREKLREFEAKAAFLKEYNERDLEAKAAILKEYREMKKGWTDAGGVGSTAPKGRPDGGSHLTFKQGRKERGEGQGLNRKRARSESGGEGGEVATRIDLDEELPARQKQGRLVSPLSAEVSGSPSKVSRSTASQSPRKPALRAPSWSQRKHLVRNVMQDTGVVVECSPGVTSPCGGGGFHPSATAHVMLENCDPMLKSWLASDLVCNFLMDRYGVQLQILADGQILAAVGSPDDMVLCLEIVAGQCVHSNPLQLAKQAAHGIRMLVVLHDYCRRGLTAPVARIQNLLQEMPCHANIEVRTIPGAVGAKSKKLALGGSQPPTPNVRMPSFETHVRVLCDTKRGPVDIDTELQELLKFATEEAVPLRTEGLALESVKVTLVEPPTPALPSGPGTAGRRGLVPPPGVAVPTPFFDHCQSQTSHASSDLPVVISIMEGKLPSISTRAALPVDGKWNCTSCGSLNSGSQMVCATLECARASNGGFAANRGIAPGFGSFAPVAGMKSPPQFLPSLGLPPLVRSSSRVGLSPRKDCQGRTALQLPSTSPSKEVTAQAIAPITNLLNTFMDTLVEEGANSGLHGTTTPLSNGDRVASLAAAHAAGEKVVPSTEESPRLMDVIPARGSEHMHLSDDGIQGQARVLCKGEFMDLRQGHELSAMVKVTDAAAQILSDDGNVEELLGIRGTTMDPRGATGDMKVKGAVVDVKADAHVDGKQQAKDEASPVDEPQASVETMLANGVHIPPERQVVHAGSPPTEGVIDRGGTTEQKTPREVATQTKSSEVAQVMTAGQQRGGLMNGSPMKKARPSGACKPSSQCLFAPLLVRNIPESWGMAKGVRIRLEAILQNTIGPRESPYINRIGFCSKVHACAAELKTEELIVAAIAAFEANPTLFDGLHLSRHPEKSLNPQPALIHSAKKLSSSETMHASPAPKTGAGVPGKDIAKEQSAGKMKSPQKVAAANGHVRTNAKHVQPRALVLLEASDSQDQSDASAAAPRKRRRKDGCHNLEDSSMNGQGTRHHQEEIDSPADGWEPGEIPPTPRMQVDLDGQRATSMIADTGPRERSRKLSQSRKAAQEADEFLQSLQDVVLSPVTSPDAETPPRAAESYPSRGSFKGQPFPGHQREGMGRREAGRGSPVKKRARTIGSTMDPEPGATIYGARSPPRRPSGYHVDSGRHSHASKQPAVEVPSTLVPGQLFLKNVPKNTDENSLFDLVEDVLRMLLPNYPEQPTMVVHVRVHSNLGRAWIQLRSQYMVEYVLEAYSKDLDLLQGLEPNQGHDYKRKGYKFVEMERERGFLPTERERGFKSPETVALVSPVVPPLVGGSNRGSVKSRLGHGSVSYIQAGVYKAQRFWSRDEMNLEKSVEIQGLTSSADEVELILCLSGVFADARLSLSETFLKGLYLFVDNIKVKCAVVEFEDVHLMHQTQELVMTKCFLNIGWHVTPASRKKSVSERFQGRIQPALPHRGED